jgi:hypothetical protein
MDARRSVPPGNLLNALSLVLAAWLAVYATHTLHLLPEGLHGTEMTGMGPAAGALVAADRLNAGAAELAHCAVEAVRDPPRGPVVAAAAALVGAAGLRRRPVAAPALVPTGVARAGPRDPLALLQVFRN